MFAFVATKIFCHDKHNFVATNVFSRQAYFCPDKRVFVATIMILGAAPANDTRERLPVPEVEPAGLFSRNFESVADETDRRDEQSHKGDDADHTSSNCAFPRDGKETAAKTFAFPMYQHMSITVLCTHPPPSSAPVALHLPPPPTPLPPPPTPHVCFSYQAR